MTRHVTKPVDTHERLSHTEHIQGSSDRGFGIVFACVFTIIGLWPLFSDGTVRIWSLAIAAGFLVVALARPGLLASLNRLWMRFGLLLSKVVNPVIMALLYYVTVTPMGLLMRALGKDLLRLRFEPGAKSYWIERRPPGPDPESMVNQF